MFRQILGKVVFILQTSITLLIILSVRDISRLTDCNSEDQVVDQFLSCLSRIALLQLFSFQASPLHMLPPAPQSKVCFSVPRMLRVLRAEMMRMVVSFNSTVNIIDIVVKIVNTYTKVTIIVKGVRARSSGCVEGIAD